MMTCREFADLVTPYLEKELPLGQRAAVSLHLAICRNCTAYLEQVKLTVEETRKLREGEPDEATRARLLAAFRAKKNA